MADPHLPRRTFLSASLLGLSGAALMSACGSAGGDDDDSSATGSADAWATGGTSAMVDKDSYPDPFSAGVPSCAVLATTTLGPCTTDDVLTREDVSEGYPGLPVRLMIKVVDTNCDPVEGLRVRIWHTDRRGVYSGDTPNPGVCSGNESEAVSTDWFRGSQLTDADGVVAFDSCFPGWYGGRAVHIHYQVLDGDTSWEVSQLFFPEDVTEEIFDSHADYEEFGQPDTVFSNDGIVQGIGMANLSPHILDVQRTSDGAMLASAVVAVS